MSTNSKALESRDGGRVWFNKRIQERNLTQDDVAVCCEVSIRTLRSWLSNGRISRDQVPGLCNVLDITAEELGKYFRISDPAPYPRRKVSALDKVGDLTELLRTVLGADCEKITLADLEATASLPFNYSAGLSDDEITTIKTLLRGRQKKSEK